MQSELTAADFAEFFNAKVEKIYIDTTNVPPPSQTDIEGELLNEFKPVTQEEVQRLTTLSPNNQCYIDRLPTWL